MRLTHLGHSCLLVESGDDRVLIDPGTFSDFAGVSRLDAVFVTHQHADHVDVGKLSGLLEANPGVALHAEPQTVKVLSELGVAAHETASGRAVGAGRLTVTPVGELHAVIHDYLPRIGNLGLVVAEADGPTLFHPGDALDADPGVPVDLLAVPLNAPWCAVKETVAFVRRIAPGAIIPIHDGLLRPERRPIYLGHLTDYGLEGGVITHDLSGGRPTDF